MLILLIIGGFIFLWLTNKWSKLPVEKDESLADDDLEIRKKFHTGEW